MKNTDSIVNLDPFTSVLGDPVEVDLFFRYTVKKANDFPVPSRDVTNQTLSNCSPRPGRVWFKLFLARESLVQIIPRQGEFG
jgi:hypothetical protein